MSFSGFKDFLSARPELERVGVGICNHLSKQSVGARFHVRDVAQFTRLNDRAVGELFRVLVRHGVFTSATMATCPNQECEAALLERDNDDEFCCDLCGQQFSEEEVKMKEFHVLNEVPGINEFEGGAPPVQRPGDASAHPQAEASAVAASSRPTINFFGNVTNSSLQVGNSGGHLSIESVQQVNVTELADLLKKLTDEVSALSLSAQQRQIFETEMAGLDVQLKKITPEKNQIEGHLSALKEFFVIAGADLAAGLVQSFLSSHHVIT